MSVQEYLVSTSGQMSLPAAVRRRWQLDDGGPVDVIDLGFAVLTVPTGTGRKLLGDLVTRNQHAALVRSLGDDPDLAKAELLEAPLCVWDGDDGPAIRAAMADLGLDYRTITR